MNPIATNLTVQHQGKILDIAIVILREVVGNNLKYIAQGVEYAICVQASSIEQLEERLSKTLLGHIAISTKLGLEPFACIALE